MQHVAAQPPITNFLHMRYFEVTTSAGFEEWLDTQQLSLAFTNSAQRLFMVGLKENGCLSLEETSYDHCLGLAPVGTHTLYMVTRYQIWRLENALLPGQQIDGGYDRLYVPQSAHTTGNLHIHDLAVDSQNQVIFTNTLYNCLATTSERHSFTPLWCPPFISEIASGNRCHLSGLALRAGRPTFVTTATRTNEPDGWRKHRRGGGAVIDIASNAIIAHGLTMPDSPRWYQNRLWLVNAGTAEFGYLDIESGRFEAVVRCPGILRGVCFADDYAILGLSKPHPDDLYAGLPLEEYLQQPGVVARCGVVIVNLHSGDIEHWLFFEGKSTSQIYDVVTLPGVRRARSVGLVMNDIQEITTLGPGEAFM